MLGPGTVGSEPGAREEGSWGGGGQMSNEDVRARKRRWEVLEEPVFAGQEEEPTVEKKGNN